MTQRDQKTVLLLILGLVGAAAVFFVVQTWFLAPLGETELQIKGLSDDVFLKNEQISALIRDRILLIKARAHSLPANQVRASADYYGYLVTLLQKSGLTEVGVQGPPAADPKGASPNSTAPGAAKKPGHTILTYQVRARGKLAAIVAALENLQRTPVMHRVKGLTVGRQDVAAKDLGAGKLTVQMTLEAMIVAGVDPGYEPQLKANSSVQLPTASNPRRYEDIANKNLFIGPVAARVETAKTLDPTEEIIPEHVRLVSTEPTAQEAFLRTLIFQMPETRIRSKAGSGYDTFRIMNEDRSKVLVKAAVLRIDQRDVYFQVREDVYGIHIGQTVGEAMRRPPLSDAELKNLNLTNLVHEVDAKGEFLKMK